MAHTRKKIAWKLVFLLPVPLLWALLAHHGHLRVAEELSLDARFRVRGVMEAPVPVVYVDIDGQAIQELGNMPWPREYFAEVSRALIEAGKAKGVGIDVVFSEKGVSEAYDRARWIDANLQFARYLRGNPPVVLAASYAAAEEGAGNSRHEVEFPMIRDGLPEPDKIPLPELTEFNLGRGIVWNPPRIGLIDTLNGATRWVALFAPTGVKRYDHMALMLAGLHWGVDPANFQVTADAVVIPAADGTVLARIPLADQQLVEVNWFSPWISRVNPRTGFSIVYNYARMLRAEDPAARANAAEFFASFKDAIVLIGPVDRLLQDLAVTPYDDGPVPKVGVHGNLLKTIVSGKFLTRIPVWGLYLITIALTVIVMLEVTAGGARGVRSKFTALATLLGYVGLCFLLFWSHHLVLPLVAPVGGALSAAFIGVTWQLIIEEKQKGRIKNMFGTYLAPALVNQMVESQTDPQLGGHEEVITAYFSDIQEFSTFSEVMTPKKLVELMNEYLTACTDIVQEEKGTLDKYIGDAVVTIFGAPLSVPDHAYRACVAAVRVQQRIDELREKWTKGVDSEGQPWPEKVHKFRARLGLNTGPVIVGNMGSRSRFSYTMMGDNVNLAARMESGAKAWGAFTMVTEATKQACEQHGGDHVVFRRLAKIVVKGRSLPVTTYEVTGLKESVTEQTRACLRVFDEALHRFYARDWDGALALFEEAAKLEPLQPGVAPGVKANPSTVYIGICREYKITPPPEDWDGVYVMHEK